MRVPPLTSRPPETSAQGTVLRVPALRFARLPRPMIRLRKVSFGTTAAIVTSLGVIVGLNAAAAQISAIVGSLLVIALADNLTDSLSVHVYQESERLSQREAFRTTVANFATRLLVSLSFIAIVVVLPTRAAILVCLGWGLLLLSVLSYALARDRQINPAFEMCKHCAVAIAVIVLSGAIGTWIPLWLSS